MARKRKEGGEREAYERMGRRRLLVFRDLSIQDFLEDPNFLSARYSSFSLSLTVVFSHSIFHCIPRIFQRDYCLNEHPDLKSDAALS